MTWAIQARRANDGCCVLVAFVRALSDALPDEATRASVLGTLVPELPDPLSTRERQEKRAWQLVDRAVRVWAPTWLEVRGFGEQASLLRSLPPVSFASADAVHDALRDICTHVPDDPVARAATDAARSAVYNARDASDSYGDHEAYAWTFEEVGGCAASVLTIGKDQEPAILISLSEDAVRFCRSL